MKNLRILVIALAFARYECSDVKLVKPVGSEVPSNEIRRSATTAERRIRGFVGGPSNPAAAHLMAINVSEHLKQTRDFYDELIVGVGLHLFAEEHSKGSGTFEPVLTLDYKYFSSLGPVMDTARELNLPVSVMVSSIPTIFSGPGNSTDGHNSSWFVLDPSDPSFNMDRLISKSVSLAVTHGWSGYNIDDEVAGAPRVVARDWELWLSFVNRWADGLHEAGLSLTADIQALSWVNVSRAGLREMLAESRVDRWMTMDTYWGGLPFFYDNLEYYLDVLGGGRLAVGLYPDGCTLGQCQRAPPSGDESTGRAWALGAAGVAEAWVWLLPIANAAFFPPMRRWKAACAGCARGTCWEPAACAAPPHAPPHTTPTPPAAPAGGPAAEPAAGERGAEGGARAGIGSGGAAAQEPARGSGGRAGQGAAGSAGPHAEAAGAGAELMWWKARVRVGGWEVVA